jgi:hypothetical protein
VVADPLPVEVDSSLRVAATTIADADSSLEMFEPLGGEFIERRCERAVPPLAAVAVDAQRLELTHRVRPGRGL